MIISRVLLAEDEPAVRELTADALRGAGVAVTEASDGDQAARLLDVLPPFDMLLTDVRMPGSRDGIVLAIYARSLHPSIPVLIVSGYASDIDRRLKALEPVVFLRKPYRISEVVRVSKRLMSLAA